MSKRESALLDNGQRKEMSRIPREPAGRQVDEQAENTDQLLEGGRKRESRRRVHEMKDHDH
jgi:hypothetical protein